jgi:hypothetical protein
MRRPDVRSYFNAQTLLPIISLSFGIDCWMTGRRSAAVAIWNQLTREASGYDSATTNVINDCARGYSAECYSWLATLDVRYVGPQSDSGSAQRLRTAIAFGANKDFAAARAALREKGDNFLWGTVVRGIIEMSDGKHQQAVSDWLRASEMYEPNSRGELLVQNLIPLSLVSHAYAGGSI